MIATGEPSVKQKESLSHGTTGQVGNITLILCNEAFRKGLLAAREWYFQGIYGEEGRVTEHAVQLASEEVLHLVVQPDEQGCYHFDEMGMEHLPEYLGYLVGYLGGPLAPDEAEHYRHSLAQQEYLRNSVPA